MGCCSMPAKLSSSVFIHRVQLSNILPSSLTTPSCSILTVLCIWVTYSHREDIIRVIKDINRKANLVLCKFHAADPSYCLSLYGATLWSLSSSSLHLIEVAVNKILRKTWNLSFIGHTLESPIALREFLLSVILFLTVSVPSSHVLFLLLTSF